MKHWCDYLPKNMIIKRNVRDWWVMYDNYSDCDCYTKNIKFCPYCGADLEEDAGKHRNKKKKTTTE